MESSSYIFFRVEDATGERISPTVPFSAAWTAWLQRDLIRDKQEPGPHEATDITDN